MGEIILNLLAWLGPQFAEPPWTDWIHWFLFNFFFGWIWM